MTIFNGVPWTKVYCEYMNNTILKESHIEWGKKVLCKIFATITLKNILIYKNW